MKNIKSTGLLDYWISSPSPWGSHACRGNGTARHLTRLGRSNHLFIMAALGLKSVLLATCALVISGDKMASKPNILFILVDDLGFAEVGFNRDVADPEVKTPNVDALVNTIAWHAAVTINATLCPENSVFINLHPNNPGSRWNTIDSALCTPVLHPIKNQSSIRTLTCSH